MSTKYNSNSELGEAYTQLIAQRFQRILDYPLYRDNPLDLALELLLQGCLERQTGRRYTYVADYFYNSIFGFCTFVTIGESGFDYALEENYTLIIDSDNGFSSIKLTDSNLMSCCEDIISPWMSTLNEKPIQLLKDTWNKDGTIWFLSYWEQIKRGICDYVNHFHFFDCINLETIRIEILKTQIFVLKKVLDNPTIIQDDEFLSWTSCSTPDTFRQILELCASVFNDSFRDQYSKLMESRIKDLNKIIG